MTPRPDDDTIFRLKRLLSRLGVSVSHPIADEIKASAGDQGFAFDPTVMTFSEVERDYYASIKESDRPEFSSPQWPIRSVQMPCSEREKVPDRTPDLASRWWRDAGTQ